MLYSRRILCGPASLLLSCGVVAAISAFAGTPLPPADPVAPPLPIASASGAAAKPAAGKAPAAAPAAAATPAATPETTGADPGTPLINPQAPVTSSAPPTRSQNVTINLINRLVKKGALSEEDAADLIKMAEEDAAAARADAAVQQANLIQATAAQISAAQEQMNGGPSGADIAPSADDVHVTYIPEIVKAQLRDQIKDEVMEQARAENWASPRILPEWVKNIKLFGDIRVRYEGDMFPGGNDNTGAFPNFNAINTGAPFDTTGTIFSPQYNVDQDRNRFRIRARLGVDADLGDNFSAGFRIATGENDSPVTANQSLGLANQGQGGNFSKYSLWLDRAFLKYEVGGLPTKDFSITLGRFDNPFFGTTLMWANDLGFDGAVIQGKYQVVKGLTPFLTMGAFPVFNTDFNFASNQPAKFKSYDKYLFAGQLGANWRINKDISLKVGGGYYYFQHVEGRLSDPFTPLTTSDAGNTDDSRPSFAQNGNTYMALRNIVPNALNNFGTIDQFQYYGLASKFHDLAFTGRLDFNHFEPIQISVIGEYIKNLAFHRGDINAVAVNNRASVSAGAPAGTLGDFAGGDTAWIISLRVGTVALEKRWDWDVNFSYRYLESDSVIDGFNDSDFGAPLTGTNLKGFTIGADLALGSRVWLGVKWMSADSIAGTPYKSDILQIDLNGKF